MLTVLALRHQATQWFTPPVAIGRISADTLAAYPPGIPNLVPGEEITEQTVNFLQAVAASPTGVVRGAADPLVATFRVVRDPVTASLQS